MATTLTPTTSSFNGVQPTSAAADATGNNFINDGRTFLIFTNSNASARTATITGNATSKPGFGDISAADMGETASLVGSGTNGGITVLGPFPQDRFNDTSGKVNITYDAVTGLNVASVGLKAYA